MRRRLAMRSSDPQKLLLYVVVLLTGISSWYFIRVTEAIFILLSLLWVVLMSAVSLVTSSQSLPRFAALVLGVSTGIGICLCGVPAFLNNIVVNRAPENAQFQWVEDEVFFFCSIFCFCAGFWISFRSLLEQSIQTEEPIE